eukprot:RCo054347
MVRVVVPVTLRLVVADSVDVFVTLKDREAEPDRLLVEVRDTEPVKVSEEVQDRLDALSLKLSVRLHVWLNDRLQLRLPDLVELPVAVVDMVFEDVLLPDSLDVVVKLRLTLHVSDFDELPVAVCVELKLDDSVSDGVRVPEEVAVLVSEKEPVALHVRLLDVLSVRLTVAEERVRVSLPLPLPDSVRVLESVALRLSESVDDSVDVCDAEMDVLRLPVRVAEGLSLKLRLRDVLGVEEELPEKLPETDTVLVKDFVQVAEGVVVRDPEPDPVAECVAEGLSVSLGLRVSDLVQLMLHVRELEHDEVEVEESERLRLSDAVPLPERDIDALQEMEPLGESEVVEEGDALCVKEAVRLWLLVSDAVSEVDAEVVPVDVPEEDTLLLRLRVWVALLNEELKETDADVVLVLVLDGLQVMLKL